MVGMSSGRGGEGRGDVERRRGRKRAAAEFTGRKWPWQPTGWRHRAKSQHRLARTEGPGVWEQGEARDERRTGQRQLRVSD